MNEPVEEPIPRTTLIGLALTLVFPLVALAVTSFIFQQHKFLGNIILEICLWSCTFGVLYLVTKVERLPLASIGLKRPTGRSIGLGVLGYFGLIIVVGALKLAMHAFGLSYEMKGMLAKLAEFPLLWRLFLVVSAAFVEEVLFRGYAIERLLPIVKSRWLAGLIPLVVFTVGHSYSQPLVNLIVIFVTGACLTVIYYWKRDLTINITTHFIVDFLGVFIGPLLMPKG